MAGSNLIQGRRQARRKVLQALYQWQYTQDDPGDILLQFQRGQEDFDKVDPEYFRELLYGVVNHQADIDSAISPHLDRPLDQVDPIERAVLRLAMFELKQRLDVPYRVIINEAVELAKMFGAEQAHKFINGVLDKAAKVERAVEMRNTASRPAV